MNQFRKYVVSTVLFTILIWTRYHLKFMIKLENNLQEYVQHKYFFHWSSIETFMLKYKYIQSCWKYRRNQSYESDA